VQIKFTHSARTDLKEILEHFKSEGLEVRGEEIVGDLIHAMELVLENPKMGRVVPEFQVDTLRELIRPPYRVVYRITENWITVVRVWRSERLMKPISE
jgi:toxin ParE1/3/4